MLINHTSGVAGPDYAGALDCLRQTRPEMAACNAGSLNYLKVRADGAWAWPPMLFDNPVEKIQDYLDAMRGRSAVPNSNVSTSASCAASPCIGRSAWSRGLARL